MKQVLFSAILLTLSVLTGYGQKFVYQPGEKVYYTIHYGVITGGVATLDIKKEFIDGKEIWHATMDSRTTGMADVLFKVLDIYESFIDPATELPVKSIRNANEGRYHRYNVNTFDRKTRSDSTIVISNLSGKHVAPTGIHDIISCFYFFRNRHLPELNKYKPGEVISMTTWFTDELYPIRMKYIATEEVKTKMGKIVCHKFNPVTEVGRLFKTQEDVSFWFSADKNFLPVKIRFDIFVGAFTVDMIGYEGTVYPLEIKTK